MKKRKLPETSMEAYRSLEPKKMQDIYGKILFALERLDCATSEQIAGFLQVPHEMVWKRMSELCRPPIEKVYNTGIKKATKSGRKAFAYSLKEKRVKMEQKTMFLSKNAQQASLFMV